MRLSQAPFLLLVLLLVGLPGKILAQVTTDNGAPADAGLVIYTENYPPLNYEEIGEAKGLSVDLLLEMFVRAKIPKERFDVVVVPWARGYTETQRRPNTILFSTVRTPAREKLFNWVGPIGISRMVLLARRDRNIDVADGANFNNYKYGLVQHSRGDQAMREAGTNPDQFIYLNSPLSAAHMLARGRVDAWAFERIVSFWVLQKLGYKAQDFKVIYAFDKYQYYFAFNPETDPELIAKLQTALDSIRADGTMSAIVEGHIPGASETFLKILE